MQSGFTERTRVIARELSRIGNELAAARAVAFNLSKKYDNLTDEVEILESDLLIEEKAAEILLLLEDAWRKNFEKNASEVISDGLSHVFGSNLYFRMVAQVRAGASALRFELETINGSTDIMKAEGGSVVQVASFLLRVIFTLGLGLRKVITLDEPFGGVDETKIPAVAMLLRDICDESNIQLIMVTHNKDFIEVADTVYEVEKAPSAAYAKVSCLKEFRTAVVDDD